MQFALARCRPWTTPSRCFYLLVCLHPLREVAQKGVSIHQAANPQIALTVLLLGVGTTFTLIVLLLEMMKAGEAEQAFFWLTMPSKVLTLAVRTLIILYICLQPRDERCFIL
eukprot:s1777_g5.t4